MLDGGWGGGGGEGGGGGTIFRGMNVFFFSPKIIFLVGNSPVSNSP